MDICIKYQNQLFVRVSDEWFYYPDSYVKWKLTHFDDAFLKWKKIDNLFEQYSFLVFEPYTEISSNSSMYTELRKKGLIS